MAGYDPSQKVGYGTPIALPNAAPPAPKPSGDGEKEGFFHHLLDVINPLQHLPVISTLYRAATGEHIGTFERIAGDTLYGGFWGAVSSVADTVFEAVTGKDFGDTVLALFTGGNDKAAQTAAAPTSQPAAADTAPDADVAALSRAMDEKGVDGDLARRAIYAYRKSSALPSLAN